jgi:acyl carrier protein
VLSIEKTTGFISDAIRQLNQARLPDQQLGTQATSSIFGQDSPLDSLGLVALVIDIEDALLDEGIEISLSDEKTMSQRNSPFRTVETLARFIVDKATSENGQ